MQCLLMHVCGFSITGSSGLQRGGVALGRRRIQTQLGVSMQRHLAIFGHKNRVRQPSYAHRFRRACAHFTRGLPSWLFSRSAQVFIDLCSCAAAVMLSFLMRFEFSIPRDEKVALYLWLLTLPFVRVLWLSFAKMYHRIWRYFSLEDAVALCGASASLSLLLLIVRITAPGTLVGSKMPLSIIVGECGAFMIFALSARCVRRWTCSFPRGDHEPLRVLLVGSDHSLVAANHRIETYEDLTVVGMIVPDGTLQGRSLSGVSVLGDLGTLGTVLTRYAVQMVLITDVSASAIGDIIDLCTGMGVDVRLYPEPSSVVRGEVRFSKPLTPELAFQRTLTAQAPHPVVLDAFRQRAVLVTGAGGSIGSELSRQVAQLPVSTLILLDQDENSIFEVRNHLASVAPQTTVVSVVGDIRDRAQMERVFAKWRPSVVLHAAAYKHVPVMEDNCCEAVLNNVLGTQILAELATFFRAERFLMISTDKAVQPSSVMGATKRVAELIVQSLAASTEKTRFACVRFGNVLGSRGSVVPIFLRQIEAGGPVTVTDEHMTRYFMTIPDAVRLVLQASSLGAQGDVFLLDMGDPVKIVDVARQLIRAAGLRPGVDIEIRFVGRRPGEKYHEQLWSESAAVHPTHFAQVFRVSAEPPTSEFSYHLRELIEFAHERDEDGVITVLQRMRIGFRETAEKSEASRCPLSLPAVPMTP